MKPSPVPEKRVLAIDPTSRGFGFAILEGPEILIDWGVKQTRVRKNPRCLKQVQELIERYEPEMIVVEDCAAKGSRRCLRVRNLIQSIRVLAANRRIRTRCFSPLRVRQVFSEQDAWTKHEIATAIARQLPELGPHLPAFRKPWMSEDERMAIFDAVAFALTYYRLADLRQTTPSAQGLPLTIHAT
jgi:Holliday junction resolvasome RuvABC endonuclease subunit